MSELINTLREQAAEIAKEGHNGWGNTMTAAADELSRLRARVERLENLPELVPTNWCDPLLTGKDSIGPPPYDCRKVEQLLRGIQDRMRQALAKQENENG